ncbi:hypothetical protein HDV00_008551 [Rhizophlyctis rosea]|nr:hypothetical protein HDV00_008551 [Rhizophlyctis rosea]
MPGSGTAKGGMVYSQDADFGSAKTHHKDVTIYPSVGKSHTHHHSQLLYDDVDESVAEVANSKIDSGAERWGAKYSGRTAITKQGDLNLHTGEVFSDQHEDIGEDMCRPPPSEVAREGHLWIQTSLHWKRFHAVATYESTGTGVVHLYANEYEQTPTRIISLHPFKTVSAALTGPNDIEVRTGRYEFRLTAATSSSTGRRSSFESTNEGADICFAAESHHERNAWVTALRILCGDSKGAAAIDDLRSEVDEGSYDKSGDGKSDVPLSTVRLPTGVSPLVDKTNATMSAQTSPGNDVLPTNDTVESLISELMDELKYRTSHLGKMLDRVLRGQVQQQSHHGAEHNHGESAEKGAAFDDEARSRLEEMHDIISKLGPTLQSTGGAAIDDRIDELQQMIRSWDEQRQELKDMIQSQLGRSEDFSRLVTILSDNHSELLARLSQPAPGMDTVTTSPTIIAPEQQTQTLLETLEPILSEIRARLTIALSRSPSPSPPHPTSFDRPTSQMIMGMNDKMVRVTKLMEHCADMWEGKVREFEGRVENVEKGVAGGDRERAHRSSSDWKEIADDVASVGIKLVGMASGVGEVRHNLDRVIDLLQGDDGTNVLEEVKETLKGMNHQLKDVKDRVSHSAVTSDRLSALISMMEIIQDEVTKLGSAIPKHTSTSNTTLDTTHLTNMVESIHTSLVSYLPIDLDTKLTTIQHTLNTLSTSIPTHRVTHATSSWTQPQSPTTATSSLTKHHSPSLAFEQDMTRHAITTSEALDSIQHTLARLVEWFDQSGVLSPTSTNPTKTSHQQPVARVVDVTETNDIKETVLEIKNMLLQDRRRGVGSESGSLSGDGPSACECGGISAREVFRLREERDGLRREIEALQRERDKLGLEVYGTKPRRAL